MKTVKPEPETEASALERARRKRDAVVVKKGWRKTIGMIQDTPFAREAFELGEQYRGAQKD